MSEPGKASSQALVRSRVRVSGRVQGVAYRAFTQDVALRMGLTGGVRNLADGRVEVEVGGDKSTVDAFLGMLRDGPPLARVDNLNVQWDTATGKYHGFQIWY